MGCGKISKPEASVWLNAFSGLYRYRVKVMHPDTKAISEFLHEDQFDEMPLTTLMNFVAFNEKDSALLDANFISVYNKENDNSKYFIDRLLGFDRNEESGLEWVVYLNKVKLTWDQICQEGTRTKPQDGLVLIYQNITENKQ